MHKLDFRPDNEWLSPRVLVKVPFGLSRHAYRIALHLDTLVKGDICFRGVGSGAVFCNIKRPPLVILEDMDINLVKLYIDIRDNWSLVQAEAKSYQVSRDVFEALRFQDYSPGREYYLRSLSSRGDKKYWTGMKQRQRRGKSETISAWETSLALLPSVSLLLQGVDIRLQGSWGPNFTFCIGELANGVRGVTYSKELYDAPVLEVFGDWYLQYHE